MADLLKLQTLIFALYFVVPGFVILKVHEHIIPSERRNWAEALIELFGYSFFNLLVCILLAPLVNMFAPIINIPSLLSNMSSINYLQTFVVSFIVPAVIGFFSAITIKSRFFHKITYGIFLHPIPTAWDHMFGRRSENYFILFHLKSGAKLGGFYGKKSFVSAFPNDQEIYVEEVWQIDGINQKIDDTAGAFIKMEECTHIELFIAGPKGEKVLWKRIKTLSSGLSSQLNHRRKVSLERDRVQLADQKLSTLLPGEVVQFQTLPQIPVPVVKEEEPLQALLQIPMVKEEEPQQTPLQPGMIKENSK